MPATGARPLSVPERLRRAAGLAVAGLLLIADVALAAPADSLVASWAIQIAGDDAQRTLRVVGIETADPASRRVFALMGYRGQRLVPVAVELDDSDAPLTMRLTTPTGAKVEVRQSEDGSSFQGQLTAVSGAVRAVQLTRMAPGEDTATASVHYIAKPQANVPAECAALSGLWEGEWKFFGLGKAWIWVLEVDADCKAKIAYQGVLARPRAFQVLDVRGGSTVLPRPQGTIALRLVGDELRGALTFFFGDAGNSGVFRHVPDRLP